MVPVNHSPATILDRTAKLTGRISCVAAESTPLIGRSHIQELQTSLNDFHLALTILVVADSFGLPGVNIHACACALTELLSLVSICPLPLP